MTTEENTRLERNTKKVEELRAEVDRLRAELERATESAAEGRQHVPAPAEEAEAARADVVRAAGDPILAGSLNESAIATTLQSDGFGTGALFPFALQVIGNADAIGVIGKSDSGVGLLGESDSGNGVAGRTITAGVAGTSAGVAGTSDQGVGVLAFSVGREALTALSRAGDGMRSLTESSQDAAVFAKNDATAYFSGCTGVVAHGGVGVGLYAAGQHAPLQLEPAAFVGSPTLGFHEAGELVLDANIDLYLCKISGSPGTWSRIA